MGQPVHTRVLKSACELVGGIDKLSVQLDVPLHSLAAWVDGRAQPPRRVFLNALDLLIEHDPGLQGAANARMVQLLQQSAESLAAPAAAAEALPQYEKLLFWDPEFLARSSRRAVLESALDAALQLTGAEAGTVHMLQTGRRALRMVVQRGFDQPFLDYFAVVRAAIVGRDHPGQPARRINQGRALHGPAARIEQYLHTPLRRPTSASSTGSPPGPPGGSKTDRLPYCRTQIAHPRLSPAKACKLTSGRLCCTNVH